MYVAKYMNKIIIIEITGYKLNPVSLVDDDNGLGRLVEVVTFSANLFPHTTVQPLQNIHALY